MQRLQCQHDSGVKCMIYHACYGKIYNKIDAMYLGNSLFIVLHNQGCMQTFCKGGGRANLGYLKKRGAQLQVASGGALVDNVLKK